MSQSIIKHKGKLYGWVNHRDGITAYRCLENPALEIVMDERGKPLKQSKKIKHFWNEKNRR